MPKLLRANPTETWLIIVLLIISVSLSLSSDKFFTIANLFNLLNTSSTNLIFAVGLLVVLIAGGIDISFAVAASVVQYVAAVALVGIGGGDWLIGICLAAIAGIALGAVNAALIYYFRIISIVVTIATFNIFFGLLMFVTRGVSIYNLPEWWTHRTMLIEFQQANGNWNGLALPVGIMAICVIATWVLIRHTSIGRQLYAFGDNPEGARRLGINIAAMHFIAFGWLGLMAGIGGLVQVHYAQEVVPNALIGRELDVLAAVVLGGARLGGGRGTVLGCILGVLLVSVTQNGLNLLGISPYAFKMIIGAIILIAITLSNAPLGRMFVAPRERSGT
ncbi:ABC transporter permease [Mesorhizobium opportunistum]|uniref:ABC transporter permease n=1 Tax=Mesorhizobium opportunistum TaxID=593909 RepID=A0ABV1YE77_9HYPH|nr:MULTISPECIES: ABC transporter permease [Mesorhizobium]ESY65580.1 sugar ABC transporter permease [Mesorhizobium sp. LNHC232B00]TJV13785.1 MAG: ABC transporter permease [Mesorhizobium sp.]TJV37561.1 MAG: ABC transporter permease [Mesorhizobium sp.]WJI41979.1 ABC transporter permease [Mesorhizobium opportunistum]